MSTTSMTLTLDTSTSRANPTPAPMKRLTVPRIRQRKGGEPLVMLTAYTVRMAQIMDPHCDMLLVGDSLGQVIYGLPHTVAVTMEMMCAHGAAVVRGSYHAAVIVDMPFGSYEASPEQAFTNASRLLKETGAAAVKLEGGKVLAPTVEFLTSRGIPVMAHVGLTPQAVNILGGYGVRGKSDVEARSIVADATAMADAGAFSIVIEGVMEPIAIEITKTVACPTIGIGASAQCDGQVLVTEDMLGLFERTPKFVKRYGTMSKVVADAVKAYAGEVRARTFPTEDNLYRADEEK
ncbi:3-methyl-2-oxobutanoate hydroxymethyltransferase [Sphingosinicella microcystinivorans]|uniref:3-methyl-2-oxobutanoate hydroxymethyltransferase n=2 Tax=Sphingosinicella microcystinivorans TaxID=335406 RepID=A0ABX9T0D4_SPHMI|nr:3-methyl-2-oxobutanoate hydroxymethyltransferase [Sphingosinicella microcystinivorans]RKS90767.1 ketopantoate hydroxymethyltransferase [Sphingosinicella microcystinivorans]